MKAKDIKKFELGEHCFGETLSVNGVEYEDLEKEEVLEFIEDMFENDVNSNMLIKTVFKEALEYLQFECEEAEDFTCDQCGHKNTYIKFLRK